MTESVEERNRHHPLYIPNRGKENVPSVSRYSIQHGWEDWNKPGTEEMAVKPKFSYTEEQCSLPPAFEKSGKKAVPAPQVPEFHVEGKRYLNFVPEEQVSICRRKQFSSAELPKAGHQELLPRKKKVMDPETGKRVAETTHHLSKEDEWIAFAVRAGKVAGKSGQRVNPLINIRDPEYPTLEVDPVTGKHIDYALKENGGFINRRRLIRHRFETAKPPGFYFQDAVKAEYDPRCATDPNPTVPLPHPPASTSSRPHPAEQNDASTSSPRHHTIRKAVAFPPTTHSSSSSSTATVPSSTTVPSSRSSRDVVATHSHAEHGSTREREEVMQLMDGPMVMQRAMTTIHPVATAATTSRVHPITQYSNYSTNNIPSVSSSIFDTTGAFTTAAIPQLNLTACQPPRPAVVQRPQVQSARPQSSRSYVSLSTDRLCQTPVSFTSNSRCLSARVTYRPRPPSSPSNKAASSVCMTINPEPEAFRSARSRLSNVSFRWAKFY